MITKSAATIYRALTLTVIFASHLSLSVSQAQTYPERAIRIVVGTTPGTPTDIVSRIIASELQKAEGWVVVVENKAGAINTIGARDVIQAPADGYSIFAASMPITASGALLDGSPVNMVRDFAPVIKASVSYNVLVTKPTLTVNSMKDLVELLKKNPGKLNYSSGGHGTPAHLVGELFKLQAKVDAVHVPYQQLPQAIQDLIGGSNDYMFVTTLPVVDLVANGNLKALAVTSSKPLTAFKGVPSVVDQGFPDLAVTDWVGFLMRQGTSPQIIERINLAINKALQSPTVREAMHRIGADVEGGTPGEFGVFVAGQVKQWEGVVRSANIKM
mgnify:CR=1 FL=1